MIQEAYITQRKHFVTFITFQFYDCQFHSVKTEAIFLREEKNQQPCNSCRF